MGKLLPLFLLALAVIAAVALTLRPGTLISISDEALATSIARSAGSPAGGCHHRRDAWFCTDGDSRMYRATVGDYGCWEAVTVNAAGKVVSLDPVSGCVNLPDVLGIGR
ncbi:MAG TPA: hypothetical protein VFH44_12205 [Solirubrobacterales bacterium]|nr:hypothetical protein [Solirubrobacterales bacterium]